MSIIQVENLVKNFSINKKESGLKGAFKNLVKKNKEKFCAVNDISFNINKGEIVGYIGPNGAGKSTTIKMMCGILQPTSGTVLINGMSPYDNRKKVVSDIGVVFGQRTQLYWDLRLGESFELLKRIYQIPNKVYDDNIKILNEILNIDEIINTPVRQLSLGQRMKGDLAAAMLHSPPLIFLDEPTIGLDVDVKYAVRKFIKDINERCETTIILTTHDLDDIEQLCNRVIIINKGIIVEDGSLSSLITKLAPTKTILIDFLSDINDDMIIKGVDIERKENGRVTFTYNPSIITAGEIIQNVQAYSQIRDISFEETSIDDVIRKIYSDTK